MRNILSRGFTAQCCNFPHLSLIRVISKDPANENPTTRSWFDSFLVGIFRGRRIFYITSAARPLGSLPVVDWSTWYTLPSLRAWERVYSRADRTGLSLDVQHSAHEHLAFAHVIVNSWLGLRSTAGSRPRRFGVHIFTIDAVLRLLVCAPTFSCEIRWVVGSAVWPRKIRIIFFLERTPMYPVISFTQRTTACLRYEGI